MFSRMNAIVRQFSRSAIRDCAVCRIGALWPSSRPATTTAITPEACTCSAATYAANGTTSDMPLSSTGSVEVPADLGDDEEEDEADEHAAAGRDAGSRGRPRPASKPLPSATASAVPSATSAVASLSSDSPSRIVTIRRGSPIRRPIAVAATASGGATTAPIARAIGHETPGSSRCATSPTPNVVNATSPTDSSRIGRRLARKSTSEVPCAAAYSSGGSSPNSTTSSESSTSGTHRDVRRRDPDGDQQERRRDVQPLGHPGAREHPHRQAAEQQGDLHGGHSPDGRRGYLAVPLSAQSGSSGNTPPWRRIVP